MHSSLISGACLQPHPDSCAMAKNAKPKHKYAPFDECLADVRSEKTTDWSSIESRFLEVVGAFDAEYARGSKSRGWYQLKARYFNDIVVAVIENSTGRTISTRRKQRSVLFSEIDIDICYPDHGEPVVAAEVKVLGTPPHPRNGGKARPARSDLHKRVREVAFTAMDIKAAYARPRTISSFQAWVDNAEPAYASFWALRVADDSDLSTVRSVLASLKSYCNGVGAVIYAPTNEATSYTARPYPEFAMDRAIRDFTQRVISA